MKYSILKKIVDLKKQKKEFAIITNLKNSNSIVYELDEDLDKDFIQYKDQIDSFFKLKNNGVIDGTDIFVETYIRPIKVIIVGAVHIAQYLVDFAKSLNFEITIIDPRGYFASEKRFPNIDILNKWPDEAFKEIETDSNTALIALTHDPKIDDPADRGSVRAFEPPHTGTNYLLKEFVYVVGRTHAAKLRIIALILFAGTPVLLLALEFNHILALLAVVAHIAGVITSRWLFFAQAEHVVGLYYGKR